MLSSIQGLFGKKSDSVAQPVSQAAPVPNEKSNISVRTPDEVEDLERAIKVGPVTFIFVHADWCGHCQTYKPIWNDLESAPGRQANMAMIHHDMVANSPTLKDAKIPGYPTVLKVYPNGRIEDYDNKDGKTNGMPNWVGTDHMISKVIENGIKETSHRQYLKTYDVKDTIQDETEHDRWILDGCDDPVDEVLDNGVKKTLSAVDNAFTFREVEDTIQNGINETLRASYLNVDNVIQDGVRTSHPRQYVGEKMIDKVIDKGVIETHDDVYHHKGRIDGVIKNGVKETKEMLDWVCTDRMLSNILENGIKETKTPGKDGDIMSTIEWMEENKSTSYTKMIDDVIDNGVKEIKTPNKDGDIQSTLEWMYKNNYQDDYNGSKMINNVIENGIKEVRPLPEQSGELRGYGDYYKLKEDRTKPFIDYLEETIKFGVKES